MTSSPPVKPAVRTPLWLRLVLFASLALNLLIAGVVLGHFLRDDPRGKVPRVDRIEAPMTFALSPEDRREIGRALRREYRENRPSRQEIVAEYRGVIAALRADPFEPARVEAALRNQRQAATDRMELGQRLLMQRLNAMTVEERHGFADRLEEGLKRGPHQRDDKYREGGQRDGHRDGHRDGKRDWPRDGWYDFRRD